MNLFTEKRSAGYETLEKVLYEGRAESGVEVTQKSALRNPAVFACIRILAETLASLPLIVYERQGRIKRRAPDFYLYRILHDEPNEFMTSFELIETLQAHLAGWGNAFCQIDYDERGRIKSLFPLNPANMLESKIIDDARVYRYQLPDGGIRIFNGNHIWHLRGLGSDGLTGYSVIGLMRHAIGLGMAAEEFGARFFGNDARPGVVLEHPQKLSKEAYENLKRSWAAEYEGVSRSHKVAILEEGLKLQTIGIPPEDAQFLETRKFQVTEIARAFRIPPHMLADLDRATFSNIEQQSLEFLQYTMLPWITRWERSIHKNLLLESEKEKYFAEFLVSGLMRGDTPSRYQAYATARQNGWMSANDIRELENMNPIQGGDVYLIPLNMVPAGSGEELDVSLERSLREHERHLDTESRQIKKARQRHRLVNSYHRLFEETAKRILRREVNDVKGAVEKYLRRRNQAQFRQWLDEFYEEHKEFIWRQMKPLYDSYCDLVREAAESEVGFTADGGSLEAFINSYLASFAGRHAGTSQNKIQQTLERAIESSTDEVEAVLEELGSWVDHRSRMIADEEAVRSNNAIAVTIYQMAGVSAIMSVAFGESCPYCRALDGKVIKIDNFFIAAGQAFHPEGADRPLTSADNLRHAPYHAGCDCMTVAV